MKMKIEKKDKMKFTFHNSDNTSSIGLAELLYISVEVGSEISTVNKFQCFILTKVFS